MRGLSLKNQVNVNQNLVKQRVSVEELIYYYRLDWFTFFEMPLAPLSC